MTALVAVNPSGFLATLYPGIDPSDYLQTKGRFHESYGEPHTGDPRIDTPMNYNRAKGVYANLEIDLGGVQIRSIPDRKSVVLGKRGSVRVELGGSRLIK